MPTIPLTQKIVERAIAAREESEFRDARTPGLMLRIRKSGSHTWCYRRTHRRKDYRREFGVDWTLDEARLLAQRLTVEIDSHKRWPDVLTSDEQFADWLGRERARRAGVSYVPPPPPPDSEIGKTWRDAQAAWVAEVRRIRRPTTAYTYDMALRLPEFWALHDLYVSRVTREAIAEAIAAIARRGAERQAEISAIAARGMFKWLGGDAQRARYRVPQDMLSGLKAPERTLREGAVKPLHVPTGVEIGAIVRHLRARDDRDGLACLLLVYSVQRRRAVASARLEDFRDVDGVPCWTIPPLHRKTASVRRRRGLLVGDHVIPLPPTAAAVIVRARELAGKSEWLFPGMRPRRRGGAVSHLDPTALTHAFADIEGCKASPHDVRRAFSTTYGRAQLTLSQTKLILDHAEDIPAGDVTTEHYRFDPRVAEKLPIIKGWCQWVDSQAGPT